MRHLDLLWILVIVILGEAAAFLAALLFGLLIHLVAGPATARPGLLTSDLIQAAVIVGLVVTAAVLALGSLGLARRRGIRAAALGFRAADWRWYAAGLGLFALFFFGDGMLWQWLDPSGTMQTEVTGRFFVRSDSMAWMLAVLVAAGPITAAAEETLFRGLLYRWFRERGGVPFAILLSGTIFGLSHFYFLSPGGMAGLVLTGEIILFGLSTAALYQGSGSLWPSILFHALNNGAVVLAAFAPHPA